MHLLVRTTRLARAWSSSLDLSVARGCHRVARRRRGGASADASGASVYNVRMARINVYMPDDLAEAARAADLNVSAIAQDAVRAALHVNSVNAWLDSLHDLEPVHISSKVAQRALDEARDELWGDV